MVFVKRAGLTVSVSVLMSSVLLGQAPCYAGFQLSHSSAPAVQSVSAPSVKEESVKPLQIFEDRYVPDSVLKKYKLNENWFQPSANPAAAPLPIIPDTLEIRSIGDVPQSQVPQLSAQPTIPQNVVDTWRARKGENLRDVLQRWSDRSKTNLMWASPDAPVLQKDFSFVGKYHDAVNQLIKADGGEKIHSQYRSEGLDPVMMTPASTVTTNTAPLVEEDMAQDKKDEAPILSRIFEPTAPKDDAAETRWFGLSGAPLSEVIQVWAEDAGVEVIWKSEKNFALKESISQTGYFEDAVFRALNQYNPDEIRPVGELYKDPATGKKVLVVKTEIN